MKSFRVRSVLGLSVALALAGAWAHADWEEMPSNSFKLDPPPAEGSAREQADYRKLLELQESRSDEQCRLGNSMSIPSVKGLFGGRGGLLSAAELNRVGDLLGRTLHLAEKVSGYFKDKYRRERPFNVDTRIEPCASKPKGAKAYPSSHAAMGFVGACVLAELNPGHAEEIMDYGKEIGKLRVVVGVHHPSDVEAGWKLGEQICRRLLRDSGFKAELEELQSGN